MNDNGMFDLLLERFPEEKRPFAREALARFNSGDHRDFFMQLITLLDVYAAYSERIPRSMIEASQAAEASATKMREDLRKHREDLDQVLHTLENKNSLISKSCEETIQAVLTIKDKIDPEKIASNIGESVQQYTHELVTNPFITRTNELIKEVVPALDQIHEASRKAARVWHRHIWTAALASSLILAIGFIMGARLWLYRDFNERVRTRTAEHLLQIADTIKTNREAFLTLSIAGNSVTVQKLIKASGIEAPNKYVLSLPGAYAAEMQGTNGLIYFEGQSANWDEIQMLNGILLKTLQSKTP